MKRKMSFSAFRWPRVEAVKNEEKDLLESGEKRGLVETESRRMEEL